MTADEHRDGTILVPPKHLAVRVDSLHQLDDFNQTGEVAVHLHVRGSMVPRITITGHQSEPVSIWETHTESGFITKPRFSADLVTLRFISRGQVTYRHRRGDLLGSPDHATLAAFEGLREVQVTGGVTALSGSIAVSVLAAAHAALTGGDRGVPPFVPVADMSSPGMKALYRTMREVHRRVSVWEQGNDLVLPLVREVISYQLLSAWPRVPGIAKAGGVPVSSRSLGIALDYIQANLSRPLTLSDIAREAGISVRSLQDKFRREMGQTPVKFIIDQRLARAHDDLRSPGTAALPIAEIAQRWGFVHISDFGQRYRRAYRQTPSETRRRAGIPH